MESFKNHLNTTGMIVLLSALLSTSSWAGGIVSAGPRAYHKATLIPFLFPSKTLASNGLISTEQAVLEIQTLCDVESFDSKNSAEISYIAIVKEFNVEGAPPAVISMDIELKLKSFTPAIHNPNTNLFSSLTWDLKLKQNIKDSTHVGFLQIELNKMGIIESEQEEFLLTNCEPLSQEL